ncbi:MAG: PTS fructose transporter subunit IIA [Peptococcaceae bacterium]|jgi:mannose/fructose-specific phosphotransferase system component IIA|nr:PTS fructose transporter subunit IIA [Peptococcaceae bacterium]
MDTTKETGALPGILILSHGPLCTSLIESAKMIAGDIQNVAALPFEEGADIVAYAKEAKAVYDKMPEGSVVLFDLFAGTPFNQFIIQCEGKKIEGLSGINLPIFLDVLAQREYKRGAELIAAVEDLVRDGIVNVGKFASAL